MVHLERRLDIHRMHRIDRVHHVHHVHHVMALAAAAVALGGFPLTARAAVTNTDTAEVFVTIQAAISDADTLAGHTIVVDAGTYAENVVLDKDLTLEGAQAGVDAQGRVSGAPNPGTESIIAPASGVGLQLISGSANSTIDGFVFLGGTRGIESASGPLTALALLNNHFQGQTGSNVFLNDSGQNITVDQNVFLSTAAMGTSFHLDTDDFDGLYFTNNSLLRSGGAVSIGLFADGNNNVGPSGLRTPIISDNIVRGHGNGMNLGTRAFLDGVITRNEFSLNETGLGFGIRSSTISDNRFFDNNQGIRFTSFGNLDPARGAFDNTVTGNQIVDSTLRGIFLANNQAPGTIGTNVFNGNCIEGNVLAVSYIGTETIDMTGNWWGDATGPLDTVGTNPADPDACPPVPLINAGGLGNAVTGDNVNYCPWELEALCSSLTLEATSCQDDADAAAGKQVKVELWMRNLTQNATGYQAFLMYDDAVLTYRGDLSDYSLSPFPLHIQQINQLPFPVPAGEIRLDGSVNLFPPDPGTDADSLLATLIFDVTVECGTTTVEFDLTQLFDSELSEEGLPFPKTTLTDTDPFVLDDTPPVITCPLDVTVQCIEDADPGILYGVADGGVGIYYNDNGGGENPLNQAYLKAQFSYTNTNGAEYNFDASPLTGNGFLSWYILYQSVPDQFGLDLVLQAPTWDGSVATPLLTAYDNTDNTLAGAAAAGSVAWAINGYADTGAGPANPANGIINSLVRGLAPGSGITVTRNDVSQSGTVYTAVVEGQLVSTGTHYWYTIGTPDSPMSNFNLNGDFYFSATLTYDSFGDAGTDLIDFFSGSITLTANFPSSETGFATAIDNCTLFPVIAYSDVDNGGSGCPGDALIITRTWTATDECGNETSCDQTITVEDTTGPTFLSVPDDLSLIADAGVCTATVTAAEIGEPTASDNCNPIVSITFVRSDGELTIDAPFDSADSPITITWTATDDCLNTTNHIQTVTVNDVNEVELEVELDTVWIPVTRCIHFVANDCDAIADVELSFIDHDGDDANMNGIVDGTEAGSDDPATPVRFAGSIEIPCGNWNHLCAKDEQHTLWDDVAMSVTGTTFTTSALLTLKPGDTDNDGDVDINDVTWLVLTFGDGAASGGCAYDGTTRDADFSNNTIVGTEDYSRLTPNWLTLTACPCTFVVHGPFVGDSGIGGLDVSIVTDFLPPASRKADLNRDGVMDYRDVRLFERRHGLPATLSKAIEATASLQRR